LVELLVVIGIIAILVTILAPALAGVKEIARRVACLSNLHAVAMANTAYAQCNRDFYVLAAEDMDDDDLLRWFGRREDMDSPFEYGGPFREFLPQGHVKPCPSFTGFNENAGQEAAFEAGCGGYGYNDIYIGGRFDLYEDVYAMYDGSDSSSKGYERSARSGEVNSPGQTVMFADCAYKNTDGSLIAYSFTHAPKWVPEQPYGAGAPNPSMHFRHEGLANVAWADGHSSSEPMGFSTGYETHGQISAEQARIIGLGWIGDYYESLPRANYLFDLD